MEERIALGDGLSLRCSDEASAAPYPTRRLQNGLRLYDGDQELTGEGVGFGVPVLKRGVQTIFPGAVELRTGVSGPVHELAATYELNLVERLVRADGGGVRAAGLYAAKDALAALHRRAPALRAPLAAASRAGRRLLGWSTAYEPSAFHASVTLMYTVRGAEGAVGVAADLRGLAGAGVTEVVLMFEQSAHVFDRYEDSAGIRLSGGEIGTWDDVTAAARVVSTRRRVAFSLSQVPGARLRRGRELVGSRLAWAGFGYSIPPAAARFAGEVRVERIP